MFERNFDHVIALAKMFETKGRKVLFGLFCLLFLMFDYFNMRFYSENPIWVELLRVVGGSGIVFFLGINIIRYIPKDYRFRGLYILASILIIFMGLFGVGIFIWRLIYPVT
jgi:hypothetical protein